MDITPNQDRAHEIADQLLSHLNCFLTRMRSVILVEDYVESLKVGFLEIFFLKKNISKNFLFKHKPVFVFVLVVDIYRCLVQWNDFSHIGLYRCFLLAQSVRDESGTDRSIHRTSCIQN